MGKADFGQGGGGSMKMTKWVLIGYEYANMGPFNNIKETEIVHEVIRDDLAHNLYDYEIEKIQKGESGFVSLMLMSIPSYGPSETFHYDPEDIHGRDEECAAEIRAWCD